MSSVAGVPSPLSYSTFGELLRYLRERAHLSQRELASLVGYHFSYISYLEKNTRIVDEATLLGRFVPALGLENKPEWVARLLELAKNKKNDAPVVGSGADEISVSEINASFLPTSLTSMIGREYESARLRKLILDPDIRLITIVGPPGVGKTCLALNVAGKVSTAFRHGVIFVDLTPIRSAEMLLPALALTLGTPESSKIPIEEAVKAALVKKSLLIVLDNFEQIVDAAPQLLPLLGAAADIKMLVTSREALRLRGEQEFHLAPLPVPNQHEKNSFEQLQGIPSVSLFIERAQAVKPEFKLDEKNASHIAEICHRLDGLPLAIELAAVRIRTMSLVSMIEQFDRRFDWLTQGARDLPAWRQTLQGAIEWSYSLLSEKERSLFCRLSIFTGGWTLEAAEEVCSDNEICLRSEILNLLIQLIDKSLVTPDIEGKRYTLLETLREFASGKITGDVELERLQKQHCEYYLKFSQSAKPHILQGTDQFVWLNLVERERNNLRAALAWAVEKPERSEVAMQFGMAIHIFWLTRSYINEARYWLGQILALDSSPSANRADLLRFASDYASSQGDYSNARLLEEEAMEISKALGDEAGIYYSLDGMAILAGMQGDYTRAAELLELVLVYRRRMGNMLLLTGTLNNLAIATSRLGNLERAKLIYAETIKINKEADNTKSLAHALNGLGEVHVQLKEYEIAVQFLRESLLIRHQLGELKGMTYSLNAIAMIMENLGDSLLAAKLEAAAAKIRSDLGVPIAPATLAENESFIKRLRVNLGNEMFEEAWAIGQAAPQEQIVVMALGNDRNST
ncbi:MAG: tetratricopeptide repeat protein [Anaerolineales bacterium]|nr:tetratricopeptide repeat protein [Anaerolineales bacterium]